LVFSIIFNFNIDFQLSWIADRSRENTDTKTY